jgi:hypothetical protein
MDNILQIWGGVGFLLNKILLMFSEKYKFSGSQNLYQKYQIYSWLIYLISLPPWIILFALRQDWIASALELTGAPAIVLGLTNALQMHKQPLIKKLINKKIKLLEVVAIVCIITGICYSLYDLNGISRFTQLLEIILTISYLFGTYLLAKRNIRGYVCYIFMHISCGWIMYIHDYFWLMLQQIISLIIILNSYHIARKNAE